MEGQTDKLEGAQKSRKPKESAAYNQGQKKLFGTPYEAGTKECDDTNTGRSGKLKEKEDG